MKNGVTVYTVLPGEEWCDSYCVIVLPGEEWCDAALLVCSAGETLPVLQVTWGQGEVLQKN